MQAPSYYPAFACVAARCRHSCCVGWEIDVDEGTLARYRALDAACGTRLCDSIVCDAEGAHFRLTDTESCPHLDEHGLCRIIRTHGEALLCDICREHPRFYHCAGGVWECGLGACCEEAARLILACPDYADFVEISSEEEEISPQTGSDFDVITQRAAVYALLRDSAFPLEVRACEISRRYGTGAEADAAREGDVWKELEFLDEAHRTLFARAGFTAHFPQGALSPAAERFLAYLIFRHASPATNDADFRLRVSFCVLLGRLFCGLVADGALAGEEAARILSEELEYSEENTAALLSLFCS